MEECSPYLPFYVFNTASACGKTGGTLSHDATVPTSEFLPHHTDVRLHFSLNW